MKPVDNFLLLYKALKSETKDKARLRRLETRVDTLWAQLSQDQKDTLVRQLIPEARPVMAALDAHAVKIKAL